MGFLGRFGLGVLLTANIFGAGSVYILSRAGRLHGFSLLWVLVVALLLGLCFHEVSGRLGVCGERVFLNLYEGVGWWAGVVGLGLSLLMSLWSVANYAVAGFTLKVLLGLPGAFYVYSVVLAVAASVLVWVQRYTGVERVVSGMLGVVGLVVVGLAVYLRPDLGGLAGVVWPDFVTSQSYLSLVVALLGTTVYYPNFLIQSSMDSDRYKGWSLGEVRLENVVGLGVAVVVSMAFVVVAALTLTGKVGVHSPAVSLEPYLGGFGVSLGYLVVFLASFTSATGTLFAAGFIVPEGFGYRECFGGRRFCVTVSTLLVGSSLVVPFVDMGLVEMAFTMPALNGLVGLPLVYGLLLWVAERRLDIGRLLWVALVVGFVVTVLVSVSTASSLYGVVVG